MLVLLDFSAAFDIIHHGILLGHLSGMGLGGTVLQWLWSFLEGRTQQVVLGDCSLTPWPLMSLGVLLCPLCFLTPTVHETSGRDCLDFLGFGVTSMLMTPNSSLSFPSKYNGAV